MTASKSAIEVLKTNDRGQFTVPNANLYPFQWLWDAGFIALGWSTVDRSRPWDELHALMRGQWPDGMVPHVVYHHSTARYFPDPDLWNVGRNPATSGISQPPVLASIALRLVSDAGADPTSIGRAAALWPALVAYHRWWHTARDPEGTGLVCSYHPWETGMDNSPAWDAPMRNVPVGQIVPYQRTDTSYVADDQRPTHVDYDRYVAIITELRAAHYDPAVLWERCSFKVADAGINAILVRADADLVELGGILGEGVTEAKAWAATSSQGLQRLWDDTRKHFLSLDLRTGERLTPATSSSFLALWAGTIDGAQRDALVGHLDRWDTAAGSSVASADPEAESYDSERYWRGPVWVNVNWMVSEGLRRLGCEAAADRVADRTRALITGAGMWEYFDPATGAGLGASDFSWTAALARYWLGLD